MVPLRIRSVVICVALVILATAAIAAVLLGAGTVEPSARRLAWIVAAAVVAALFAAGASALIAASTRRRLLDLRAAALALGAGDFSRRSEGAGGGEVGELATAFNQMAARLEQRMDQLLHERSRLEALLAAGADELLALDRSGVVRYLNPSAEMLFGKAIGRSFAEVTRNHDVNGLVRRALISGERESVSVQLTPRDLWFQATAGPVAGGGDWAAVVVLQDITDVRRTEAVRRDFVANVSHELRTPLAGIKAVVETLRDGALEDSEVAMEFLGRVDAEVDRLVHLVEELLQLARIESGAAPMEMAEVRPRDLLALAVERFRHQAERGAVDLSLEAPDLPAVRADPERLGQAVGNLIQNGLKFSRPGGRVTVAAQQAGRALQIIVADTGSGIDPADMPRIFERFYVADRARARSGTGLGLAIVKHVVRAHGGTVTADSRLGAGSRFTITLPVDGRSLEGEGSIEQDSR